MPGKTGRKEFVDRCLSEEAEAIVHEIQIVKETYGSRRACRSQFELELAAVRYKRGGKRAGQKSNYRKQLHQQLAKNILNITAVGMTKLCQQNKDCLNKHRTPIVCLLVDQR